jgi:hypothetical protein
MSGEVYQSDTRAYTGMPDIDYSLPDQTDIVSRCGRIGLGRKKLISVRFLLVKLLVSRRSKKVFGWSALRIKILGTSIWRKKLYGLSKTLLAFDRLAWFIHQEPES